MRKGITQNRNEKSKREEKENKKEKKNSNAKKTLDTNRKRLRGIEIGHPLGYIILLNLVQ